MTYRPFVDPKVCFVLMPFGEPFNTYYEERIKPAIEHQALGLRAQRGDEIYGTAKPVIHQICDSIWRARLVIADVSGKNPNVNYELGYCHALNVPTILITQTPDDVPFDYRHLRYIVYTPSDDGFRKLATDLHTNINAALLESVDGGGTSRPDKVALREALDAATEETGNPDKDGPVQDLLSAGLLLPLGNADTHLLQVLLTDCVLQRTENGGLHLFLHFDDKTPAIWRREAKTKLTETMGDFGLARQAQIDLVMFGSERGPLPIADENCPFRYANGGVLPIIRKNGKHYYCLFYRDVKPIGWNIANGGSDSREELLDPTKIIEREFREELLVMNRAERVRYVFPDYAHPGSSGKVESPADRPEFVVAWKLWETLLARETNVAGLRPLKFARKLARIEWIDGPDSMTIQADGEPITRRHFFLNISAPDNGIEVDRVAVLDLPDEVQLLDGEVYGHENLLNRPIGLFLVEGFPERFDINKDIKFLPDETYYSGKPGNTSVIEQFVLRQQGLRIAHGNHYENWQKLGPHRYNLCPVTRNIIRNHINMGSPCANRNGRSGRSENKP